MIPLKGGQSTEKGLMFSGLHNGLKLPANVKHFLKLIQIHRRVSYVTSIV